MRKKLALLLVLCLVLSCFAGCGSKNDGATPGTAEPVTVKFSVGFGNSSRTMTYNQTSPLTLSDGTVITQGMMKPVWTYISSELGINFVDVTTQDADADDMIATASTTGFKDATIYGGNSIATDLINYGAQGYFISLSDAMDAGKLPNFTAFLDANPDVKKAITAYDGNIYHIPYTAEIGNPARQFVARESWVSTLLDGGASYDTNVELDAYYEAFYGADNARTGSYGGEVNPVGDTIVTKETAESIIEIQNALSVKNGETLATALVEYIQRNYPQYENPSDLYIGLEAAYDIDELVALLRVVKTNPTLLTDGAAAEVWPFFTRYSKYREDTLKLITYMDGVKVNGSDSYSALWSFDETGNIYYTYTEEAFYDGLVKISQMFAEGLIYSDTYDETNTAVYRTTLYGSDSSDNPSFGFMTYDWLASTTSESLNTDATVILPPVAEINGTWQYFNENTRVIKPDGWSISAAATQAEQDAALKIFDYNFSQEGMDVVNYGLPQDIDTSSTYVGPDGVEYPKLSQWTWDQAATFTKGDASTFLRDYMGSIMAVGFVKEIGMEYQTTGQQGFDSWAIINGSNTVYSSYAGDQTDNSNGSEYYSKLIPPVFSMTTRQSETIETSTSIETDEVGEYIFNIIQYQAKGNAPAGTFVAGSYEEFLKAYQDAGLETYVKTYQDAYAAVAGN